MDAFRMTQALEEVLKLPDFAYEQIIGTKEMFGQTGGRQGYHFSISLKPGEGTKEQMYEITRRFAEK